MTRNLAALLLTNLLASATARAQEPRHETETIEQSAKVAFELPRTFFLELNIGNYTPAFSAPAITGRPDREPSGRSAWSFGAELDWAFWRPFGSCSLAFASDYASMTGKTVVVGSETAPIRGPTLAAIPLRLLFVYRFDLFARSGGIPLVPFVKAGLSYTLWWLTNGPGAFASSGVDGTLGGKWGYELAAGLVLNLNFLDPALARVLEREVGIDSVGVHVQYVRTTADNFGRPGLDLTASTVQFGLSLEF